ncbi:class I SAM-dependent methyltransferase [Neisseria musculi]|uniref:S-adenosyl-L-methionine-dependent methyltransferase family protein n=1 Tax=Neisseria musculi TaxID=1815583 RepID=A0A7H1M832_9NEIS|nr:SAM-dependent methyltransferase [Neisseria musculi]QNT57797.1 S-adenosyl-L-methionine-dependent methyltransferase family protein [Neisseria musculi]
MTVQLPTPPNTAAISSQALQILIAADIREYGGWIPFSRFMELALYAPRYGYYTGGGHKIGAAGDFITAPALTPLFGRTLARQLIPLLPQTDGNIYEFGAGTGELAASLLQSLSDGLNHYYIIEISNELAERQRACIDKQAPHAAGKVVHLTELPDTFNGIIIANEVLDAMPCELIRREHGQFWQIGVALEHNAFIQSPRPLSQAGLLADASACFPSNEPYTSELHPVQHAFIRTLAEKLVRGGLVFIDYGFDAAQYYHPQRHMGTLIGHYRHHTVHDPFFQIGLTDLTAHVNFTGAAQAGTDGGLDLIGYTTQANFLLNLGITELLVQTAEPGTPAYIRETAALHKLLGQHEMGDLFKVMAFGRDVDVAWPGFAAGDICHKL